MLQRAVNYTVNDGEYRTNGEPIRTRNFLLRLDEDLMIRSSVEILAPANMPPPAFDKVLGFEDARLFAWREELWCIACVRELNPEGWCEQVLARIEEKGPALPTGRLARPPSRRTSAAREELDASG